MYKAKWFDGHKLDNIIDVWTMLVNLPYVTYKSKLNFKEVWKFIREFNYSHVEKWAPYQGHGNPRSCDWWNGDMSTSTMRDEYNGTVSRSARWVMHNVDRWDAAEFEVPGYLYRSANEWEFAQILNNIGYAKQDIAQFSPVIRHIIPTDPRRNICSEFMHNYMVKCNIFLKFRVLSPRLLAWLIYKELGKEFKPVKEM
jgi:hypothetical protein